MGFEILGADGVTVLSVDSTSKAARITLYDQYGNPMSDVNTLGNVLNALNAATTVTLGGQSTTAIDIESTSGTITATFEATINNSRWFAVAATPVGGGAPVSTTTANGAWILSTSGYFAVRVRISAISGGASMTVNVVSTPESSATSPQTVMVVDPNGNANYGQQVPAAVTLSALDAAATIAINGMSTLQIQTSGGNGSLTVVYEASSDSTNGVNGTWDVLQAQNLAPLLTGVATTQSAFTAVPISTNSNSPYSPFPYSGQFSAKVAGYTYARVRVSAFTSGSVVVNLIMTPGERPEGILASPSIITGALGYQQGVYAIPTQYQALRVSKDATAIFYENFIGAVLDVSQKWSTPIQTGVGTSIGNAPTGGLVVTTGTAALSNAELSSVGAFQTLATPITIQFKVQVEPGSFVTGVHRFWGLGTKKTTGYTDLAPLQDGVGFEINAAGVMNAVVYANGVLQFSQALPYYNDGAQHSYIMVYATALVCWFFVDSNEVTIAAAESQAGVTFPTFTGLPAYIHAINGSSILSGAITFNVTNITIADNAGNQAPTTITGPQVSDQANPFAATVFTSGELRVQGEPSPIFVETFEGATLDTANRWNATTTAGGAAAPVYTPGQFTLGTGTTANGYSYVTSQPMFQQEAPAWLQIMHNVIIESPVEANAYRFWGVGTIPAVPTAALPLTDAVGFEITTAGKLVVVVYQSGTRLVIQDLSAATGNNRQPANALLHTYFVFYRDDQTYWAIDNSDNVVATSKSGLQSPSHCTLPLAMMAVAGSSAPLANGQLVIESVFLASTAHSNTQISDGLYGWRKASVKGPAMAPTSLDSPQVMTLVDGQGNPLARTTSETMLWHDAFEGSNVNAFWTQAVTTQTIVQATGVLTLNNSGITTVNTTALITSQRQFSKQPRVGLKGRWKANISANAASNHTLVELGFGAPTNTAIINNGCFFRVTAAGNLVAVTSYNGTETVSATLLAQGSIVTTDYYRFDIFVDDQFARFVVSDASGIPVVDFQQAIPLATPSIWAVSHLPTFARVYVDATGGGTAVKLNISAHNVQMADATTNMQWNDQSALAMRSALINPLTGASTMGAMNATPATLTPANATTGFATLGGEYAFAGVTAIETGAAIFSFQVPTPYSFVLTGIQIPAPMVTTAMSLTGVPFLEWFVVVNATTNLLSTGGGLRQPLGIQHTTVIAPAIGVTWIQTGSGVWSPKTPLVCLPGLWLHIGFKWLVTSAAGTPGVNRGTVAVDGYWE